LTQSDVGATVRVVVTASNSAGQASASSAATAVVTQQTGPTSPVLDTFNRANGALGPNWGSVAGGFVNLVVSANTAVDTSASSYAWNYWKARQFGPNSEAYATAASLVQTDLIRVCVRLTSPTSTSRSGYCLQESAGSWSIRRIDLGTSVQIGGTATQPVAVGDRLAIRAVGSTITVWYQPSGGSWTQLLSTTDGTYATAGYAAIETRGSALDDFGAGSLP
jgi:hypothetical protein